MAVLAQNRTEYFEAFAGIGAAGMMTVNLNWRLAAPELQRIVADAEPEVLIFDESSAELAAALRTAPSIRHCIGFDAPPEWAVAYEDVLASAAPSRPPVAVTRRISRA